MIWPDYSNKLEQRVCRRHTFSAELIDSLGGEIFVDIGCGHGTVLANVKRSRFRLGIERTLQDSITARTNSRCSVIVADACRLPIQSKVASVVGLLEVFEHIDRAQREALLNETNRILLPKGYLVLSVPYDHFISKFCDPAWYFNHPHFSSHNMSNYFAHSWFTVIDLFKRSGFWDIATMINLYVCKWFFNKEQLFRSWFESKRTMEFDTFTGGFQTLFVVGRKE